MSINDTLETLEKPFKVLENAEWFAIIPAGNIAFRFGPYTGIELGKIIGRCVKEQIPLVITANCGQEFDWELAADMRKEGTYPTTPPADTKNGEASEDQTTGRDS